MAARFLTPLTFDILWEEQRLGEQPYPLRVPSHGETMDERSLLRQRVGRELSAQGLKDSYGRLDPALDAALRMLAVNQLSVDAVHIPDPDTAPLAALAATDGATAVLATQDADGIWLREIFPDALVSEIVNLLPSSRRGVERSVTLSLDDALRTPPARVKVAATGQAEATADAEQKGRFGLRKPPRQQERPRRPLSERTAGNPREDYALLAAQPRLRGGQIAVNARNEAGRKFRSPVLGWFDTVTGRYLSITRAGRDGHEWVTLSPADAKTLRTRLADMMSEVSAQAR
ncbi:MAG: ESX secretion-associated protein EspG [Actinophytocola sp.]|nr:ESX secretion-associated protein EspG [Actinophytocola sp.]